MKTRLITINFTRKYLVISLLILSLILISLGFGFVLNLYNFDLLSSTQLYKQLDEKTIGIDPGHGGYDPGFFKGDITESEIVLDISLKLRRLFEQTGSRVVMTRERDKDLCDEPKVDGKSDKVRDLSNRVKILEENNVDIILSIHANSIPSSVWHGSQTFYQIDDEIGRELAYAIQNSLIENLKNTDRTILSGDYYILRESSPTGVVVEVGFLSNPTEGELLTNEVYQEKVAWAIYLGVLNYIAESNR